MHSIAHIAAGIRRKILKSFFTVSNLYILQKDVTRRPFEMQIFNNTKL